MNRARVFVASDLGNTSRAGGTTASGIQSAVEVYDPMTNTWSSRPSMSDARLYAVAGEIDGVIYVVGGWNFGGPVASVEAYDPAANTWAVRGTSPSPRFRPAAGVINGVFFLAGGENNPIGPAGNSAFYLSDVQAFVPSTVYYVHTKQ